MLGLAHAEGFQGKRIWVVGGTRGIGYQSALDLCRLGARVAISGRDPRRLAVALSRLQAIASAGPMSVTLELTQTASVTRAAERVLSRLGGLDGVIVSSGAPAPGGLFDLSDSDWLEGIQQKLLGQIRVTRAVLPYLMQQKAGRVVHIAGSSGLQPQQYAVAAGVVNAGILSFVKAISAFCARANVLINAVNPGPVDTERMQIITEQKARQDGTDLETARRSLTSEIPIGRFAEPSEVSSLIVWLLDSGASFCTGSYFNVDGGQVRAL